MEVNILEFCFGGVVVQQLPMLAAGKLKALINCPQAKDCPTRKSKNMSSPNKMSTMQVKVGS
jgi:hypothetical protein